jgi:hypothetical protein
MKHASSPRIPADIPNRLARESVRLAKDFHHEPDEMAKYMDLQMPLIEARRASPAYKRARKAAEQGQ